MASKTAGAAEKLNGGSGKMEDMAEKMEDVAKKWKTIGKEDGGCGGEDGGCGGEDGRCDGEDGGCGGEDGGCGEEVKDYRQRRRRMSATNLRQCRRSSGQGLRNFLRKRAMCKWSQNKLLGMAENATMAAVFA